MKFSRKYCSVEANSILESVVALSIISICLFIAVMVFASVFNERTSVRHFEKQHRANELFYLLQVRADSVTEDSESEIDATPLGAGIMYTVNKKDSIGTNDAKTYYILNRND